MNIIETMSTAFNTIIKRIWLLVIPIALDMFLWLGPKVSVVPLVNDFMVMIQQGLASAGTSGQTNGADLVSSLLPELQAALGNTNLLALLSWGRVGVPSVSGLLPITSQNLVLTITTPVQMVGIELAILALGLFLACIFIGLISQAVRGEGLNLGHVLRRAPTHWLYLVLISIPLFILMILALVLGTLLGPLVFLVLGGILWISLYLFFVPQAVILSDASPLEALRDSFIIVRLNFWSSLGLILLVYLIGGGFGLIWSRLTFSPFGIVGSILANAFVGTGLLAAVCFFYRDRMAKWQQMLQQNKKSI
ncbi:MAG: hypothetical protein ACYCZF_08815 [Anaerolineae bacterium]